MRLAHALIALTVLSLCCTAAFADGLVYTASVKAGDNANEWVYTLHNNDLSGRYRVIAFVVYWDELISEGEMINNIGSPFGEYDGLWEPLPDANTDATWINMTPGDPVLPPAGGSITGFTVGCSTYLPVYEVFYYDIDDPFMSELTTGFQSVTMSSVPEPGTMTALALAFGCLAPMMRKLKS